VQHNIAIFFLFSGLFSETAAAALVNKYNGDKDT
jgi:hypothetical protein